MDYLTEEEKDAQRQVEHYQGQAERGQMFVDWLRAPAGVIFKKMLDDKITDMPRAQLLAASQSAAEEIRIETRAYLKIQQWIASQIVQGRVAEKGLKQFSDEGAVLSNMIRPPERPE